MKTFIKFLLLFALTCCIFSIQVLYAETNQESIYLSGLRESFSKALYDFTIEEANRFLISDPLSPQRDEVYILVGKSYFHKESYEEALHSFEEAFKIENSGLKDDACIGLVSLILKWEGMTARYHIIKNL